MDSLKGVIIINIIFDNVKNNIKITNGESLVQLNNLKFFVPKTFNSDNLFAVITTPKGNENIIKLTNSLEVNKNFDILKASLESVITADESGESQILLLYIDNGVVNSTNALSINVEYRDYEKGQTIFLLNKLSNDVAVAYEKVMKLTELNIQLYNDIREVAKV